VYIGDSASESFLQAVRRAVADSVGPCEFTTDPLRHRMLERTPTVPFGGHKEPEPDLVTALALVEHFALALSGVLDLFDQSWLTDQLPEWVADSSRRERRNSPIIYLSLAIGALVSAVDDTEDDLAEQYFGYGRQLAVTNLMDDPSLLTVQAFSLLAYYMLIACRRNGAFINLGVALRAAYALGIHRHEANVAFVREEGISRERAWKSIRVCDLFLSASMGRPLATYESDCNIPWAVLESSTNRENSSVPAQVSSAIFRICHIFERILNEVYSNRAVSLELAASISQQHREWTAELPKMLKIDGLFSTDEVDTTALCRKLGAKIVNMAYYYSIILLTRPFLTFCVNSHKKRTSQVHDGAASPPGARTYADACVDSAIQCINIADVVVSDEKMPKRHPLIVNDVFFSALCLGLSYLGDYDRQGWPLGASIDKAITIFNSLALKDPYAARCEHICRLLRDAAAQYVRRRDETLLQSSSQQVRHVFGDLQDAALPRQDVFRRRIKAPRQSISSSTDSIVPIPDMVAPSTSDVFSTDAHAYNELLQGSMITMSGMLTTQQDMDSHYQNNGSFGGYPLGFFEASSPSDLSNFPFRGDIPLFYLMGDTGTETYTTHQNEFS
jgi:hypothetical protein